jgi:endopeptidase La
MSELSVKDFIFSYLQSEYKRYSCLITNFILHIERLNNYNILNNNERIQYIKTINELIRELNDAYNNRLRKIQNEKMIEDDNSENKTVNNKNIKLNDKLDVKILNKLRFKFANINTEILENSLINLLNLNKALKIQLYKEFYIEDFEIVRKKLLKMGNIIGFFNLDDALNLVIGVSYKKIFNKTSDAVFLSFLEIITSYYIPLSLNVKKIEERNNENIIDSFIKDSEHDTILENYAQIDIKIKNHNVIYTFDGYYMHEPINSLLRTSQICKNYIYNKKKDMESHINCIKYINDKFKNIYLKNLTIGEIISYNKTSLLQKTEQDYEKYAKYSKMSFKNLMSEFNKENNSQLKNMFNIIKLLLLGPDDCINIAGLLFGLTKDKKNGSGIIADIIYKNLNYTSQIKLRKSSTSIKSELEKLKMMTSDDVDLKKQVALCRNMPANIKKVALEKIDEMKSGSSEYYKQLTYVNILINFPWIGEDDDIFKNLGNDIDKSREFLEKTKKTLDEKVFGHEECKGVMQELIGKWLTNPNSLGKAIGLVGPPGVGKTLIAKGLGDALGIPFVQINLGGLEDGCVLSGHSYTYSAAQPGLIVRKMVDAGKSRCVLFFDELDKACAKHGVNEIFNVLIHTTDTNTNNAFNDKFFQEVTFPINKVLFVFSYNDAAKVDKILLDRMEKIEVKPYSIADKLVITNNFLLKEISEGIGLEYGSVKLSNEDIEYIIESHTFEAGVRELKRKLETLFLKLNLDRIYKRNTFDTKDNFSKDHPVILDRTTIDKYLNKPSMNIKTIHKHPDVGIINGLYATTNGSGGIIPILIYNNFVGGKDKFVLKITGSQGKVMKESVSFAFTTAMNLLKDTYRKKFIKEYPNGLHVHTPDGATPKDGPSAGSAFTTAFISRILGKKIRNDIAMTGEIEMNGNITEIGGLAYKLLGAKKAGIKLVFVPKENEKDFNKIKEADDKLLSNGFEVKIVNHISEILDMALLEDSDGKFDSKTYLDDKYLLKN